jgi:hypothetical protein
MSSLPSARALPVPAEKRKPPAPYQNESVGYTNSDNKKKRPKINLISLLGALTLPELMKIMIFLWRKVTKYLSKFSELLF